MSTISSSNNSSGPDHENGLLPSRRGGPTCRIRGRFYHSAYDPEKEAAQIVNRHPGKTAALIIGAGLGYLGRAWSEATGGAPALEISLSREIHKLKENTFPDRCPGVSSTLQPARETVRQFLTALDHSDLSAMAIIENPAAEALFPDNVQQLRNTITGLLQEVLSDRFTEWEFQRLWFRNIIRNIPAITRGTPFLSYMGRSGGSAIIIGAGPTLPNHLLFLKEAQQYAPLLAADTALPVLAAAGIEPDWVVSLDGQIHNLKDFEGIATDNLRLLTEPTVYHAIPDRPFREVVFFETARIIETPQGAQVHSHPLILWVKQCLGELGPVTGGGNVTTTAMALATAMGYDTLLLAGVDNGFPGTGYHCRGSYTHTIDTDRCTRLSPAVKLGQERIRRRKRISAFDYRGRTLMTDPMLQKFAGWSGEAVTASDGALHWYNISEYALAVEGIALLSEREALEQLSSRPGEKIAMQEQTLSPENSAALKKRVAALQEGINSCLSGRLDRVRVGELFRDFPFLNRAFEKQLLYMERRGQSENGDFLLGELQYQLTRTAGDCTRALLSL